MLRMVVAVVLALGLLACSGAPAPQPEPAPTPTEPAPTPTEPTPTEPAPADDLAAQGEPCADKSCAEGLECVRYYGIAGPSGPEFTSCEIRCADDGAACPEGQRCTTIADGPGQVCRAP